MFRKMIFTLLILIGFVFLTACSSQQINPKTDTGLANPASVNCEKNGGKLDMRQYASGGTVGICVFPDGSECDEWAYFRGECKPGDSLNPQPTTIPSPQPTSYNWKQYRDEASGLSFQYPPDTEIVMDDNPTQSISVVGLQKEGDRWPFITLSYPSDRAEYRPPEGTDLLQWLTDHNLLGDPRAADVEIAGTTAIHLRHERSPQTYAYDRYYFAKSGQLYMLVIGHTGDREDWVLYEHFLYTITLD